MMCADEMIGRAEDWVASNPKAWEQFKRLARDNVFLQRRFSIDQLAIVARYEMQTNGLDQGFKMNNSLRAPLARMLIEQVPGADRYMETRKSKVDS